MALLARLGKVCKIRNQFNPRFFVPVAVVSYWNKDWKPGPYPKTKKERDAAAKKYGLLPEDYEPYPDDGMGYGDYPNLPIVSGDARNPYENWDYGNHRMNFGEPIHVDWDMYGQDRINYNARPNPPYSIQLLWFLGTVALFFAFSILGEKYRFFLPVMPKQLPAEGIQHYTFEPED